jgi:hypothetical protein
MQWINVLHVAGSPHDVVDLIQIDLVMVSVLAAI